MNPVPFYRRAGFRTVLGLLIWLGLYLFAIQFTGIEITWRPILIALMIFFGILLVSIAVVSQFILPVRTLSERFNSFIRLLDVFAGLRGPVIFVENGEAIEAFKERERRGAGVLLIDYSSSAVLRTETEFRTPSGPGIVFSAPGERLAETLDLRRQARLIRGSTPNGPGTSSLDNPTLAMTQDGFPISADLFVSFILDPGHTSSPREGKHPNLPPYEFYPPAAERAVLRHTYGEKDDIPWTELPARLMVDLWREAIKNYSIDNLLDQSKGAPAALDAIRQAIHTRLSQPLSSEITSGGVHRKTSREYMLLSSRGIRILAVGISNIYLPEEILAERALLWCESWSGEVDATLNQALKKEVAAGVEGERQAYETLATTVTEKLRQSLARGEQPKMTEVLSGIFQEALQLSNQRDLVADGPVLAQRIREILEQLAAPDDDPDRTTGQQNG